MARYIFVTSGEDMEEGSGLILMLGMIVMSVAIMSMVFFGCGDCSGEPRKSGGRGYYGGGGVAAAYGGSGGGGGAACGGGGGGGGGAACGGGGGGGGGGC